MVPRDKRATGGSQARLAPAQDIQGRLGSERGVERRRETRGTAPGAKTHWGRDRKRTDGSRLGDEEGIGGMLPVWQKGALPE